MVLQALMRLRRLPPPSCWLIAGLGLLVAPPLHAQQWRGRVFTRLQYVEAQPLGLDSVPVATTTGTGQIRQFADTPVTCAPGATHCFFYVPQSTVSTTPVVQDLDLNVWGFGVEGLRLYGNVRLRAALGDEQFWPRSDDHFDLFAGYLELERQRFRVRLGRDYQMSGLGYYGYDGGSAVIRLPPARVEIEAYGGWGLARGLAEPVTSAALASLEEFQPRDRNLLFGFRGSARPIRGAAVEAIYQREIATDRAVLASERVAVDASYFPLRTLSVRGHADYDLATGWWGKAGARVGWAVLPEIYVEGRVVRYRPVFSLQTIWAVFSPTPYTGWGAALGINPMEGLSLRLDGERRDYGETDAAVPFQVTTDRVWRAGASGRWQPVDRWDVSGGYWLNFSPGAALSAGDFQLNVHPTSDLSVGARFSAFQQLGEFRVGEGRVWSLGGDIQYRSPLGTVRGSLDRYEHDRRGGGATQLDWTQWRGSFGLAFYVGSEPGRGR